MATDVEKVARAIYEGTIPVLRESLGPRWTPVDFAVADANTRRVHHIMAQAALAAMGEREAVDVDGLINGMCLTYRHDFGLLPEPERAGLRMTMRQIYEHNVKPAIAAAIGRGGGREGMSERRWINRVGLKQMAPDIDAFLFDIKEVCRAHGLCISHEDQYGAFQVVAYNEGDIGLLMLAEDARLDAPKPRPQVDDL